VASNGWPVKVFACHCRACRKHTDAAFGAAVFFAIDGTTAAGPSGRYVRIGESGKPVAFHFCGALASTVFRYQGDIQPQAVVFPHAALEQGLPGVRSRATTSMRPSSVVRIRAPPGTWRRLHHRS